MRGKQFEEMGEMFKKGILNDEDFEYLKILEKKSKEIGNDYEKIIEFNKVFDIFWSDVMKWIGEQKEEEKDITPQQMLQWGADIEKEEEKVSTSKNKQKDEKIAVKQEDI